MPTNADTDKNVLFAIMAELARKSDVLRQENAVLREDNADLKAASKNTFDNKLFHEIQRENGNLQSEVKRLHGMLAEISGLSESRLTGDKKQQEIIEYIINGLSDDQTVAPSVDLSAKNVLNNSLLQGLDVSNVSIVNNKEIKSGTKYTGCTFNGKPHGLGVKISDNGRNIIGHFYDGVIEGEACFVYENGDKYFGGHKRNKRSGLGKYTHNDGATYEGNFERNKRDGLGSYTSNLHRYEGNFHKGEFVEGFHQNPLGEREYGKFKNWEVEGKLNGKLEVKIGGNKHIGEFVDGKPEGRFLLVESDGDIEKTNSGFYNNGKKERELNSTDMVLMQKDELFSKHITEQEKGRFL